MHRLNITMGKEMNDMTHLPKVSIVVTTYLEKTKRYLDICMRSIENLNYPKERLDVILVGRKDYMPEYPSVRTVCPEEPEFSNPKGLNFGINSAHPDSEYFFILNDDVVLTPDSLVNLVMAAIPNVILNPMELAPIAGIAPPSASRSYGLIEQEHLCMFATLIPRLVLDKIGGFDENFKTGQDDIDYSWRAKDAGINLVLCLHSLVWHFGGTSANTTINNKMRVENVNYFKSKWGKLPPYVTEESLAAMEADQIKWS